MTTPPNLDSPAAVEERQILNITKEEQEKSFQGTPAINARPGDNIHLANLIYGEASNQNEEVMRMVGSTVLNRVDSGRDLEFGSNVVEVIMSQNSPYFAALNNSPQFKQAVTGKFPDKISEKAYKKALQVANGLIRGTIPRHEGMFFFEGKEISAMKRRKKKVFDFKRVKDTGKVGKFRTFSY